MLDIILETMFNRSIDDAVTVEGVGDGGTETLSCAFSATISYAFVFTVSFTVSFADYDAVTNTLSVTVYCSYNAAVVRAVRSV